MFAIVTGADSGIGYAYSKNIAARGYELLMVSNRVQELQDAAAYVQTLTETPIHYYTLDLAGENAAHVLYDYCKANNWQIDLLINNAGVFFFNEFIRTDLTRINVMLNLHIRCVTQMCRLFGADMCERGSGYILNMSSLSAWMAMPGINVYNATKSYILNFSKSLWYEMRPHGVTVTAICPGAVDTGLYTLAPRLRKLAVSIGVCMPPARLLENA